MSAIRVWLINDDLSKVLGTAVNIQCRSQIRMKRAELKDVPFSKIMCWPQILDLGLRMSDPLKSF